MKKITLLLIMLTVSLGYSQTDVIENFDGGTQPGLAPDNGECTTIGMTVTSAQSASAPNSLEIVAQAAGNPWQGAQLILQGAGMELTSQLMVTVDVYSNTAAGILAKVTDGSGPDSASAANHGGTGWETLTYNFADGADGTTTANGVYPVLRFYPLWSQSGGYAGQGTAPCVSDAPITIYVDNIIGTAPTAGIEDYQLIDFSTYPNPTRDSWTVKTKNKVMSSIQVFDVLGKNVLSMKPNLDKATIDGSNLKAGIYFAQVRTAEGSSSIKLIKQ